MGSEVSGSAADGASVRARSRRAVERQARVHASVQGSQMLASTDEVGVYDLTDAFDVSGPTISHHLRVLREAGVVTFPAGRPLLPWTPWTSPS